MTSHAPVALFAYRRPDLLARTLEALRANGVRELHAFSDGARGADDADDVGAVRRVLGRIDWATVHLVARDRNLGLGTSIVTGVSDVLRAHDRVIVVEDDLVAVPGTVAWLSAALEAYAHDARVLSASAWTHPRVTPHGTGDHPFFSMRVNTLFWGTYARAWTGMSEGTAAGRLDAYRRAGRDADAYGRDLGLQAAAESARNLWAVRFIAEHFVRGGLSVCPPWAMVEHAGYDPRASNAVHDPTWFQPAPTRAAPVPASWPDPMEDPAIARLWHDAVEVELRASRPPGALSRVGRWFARRLGGGR